jgi:hypothetical protein
MKHSIYDFYLFKSVLSSVAGGLLRSPSFLLTFSVKIENLKSKLGFKRSKIMKKFIVITFALLLIAFSASAAAIQKGLYETKLSIEPDATAGNEVINIQGGLAYYFTDNILAGAIIGFSPNTPFESYWGTDDVWGLGAFAEYNFNSTDASLVPFVGISVIRLSADDNDASSVNISAGIKYFITDAIAISAEGIGHFANDKIYNCDFPEDDDGDEVNVSASIGLRFLL